MITDQALMDKAVEYLLAFPGITQSILTDHLKPEPKPDSMEKLFRRFCDSVINKQRTPNVIKGTIGDLDALSTIFHNFSPRTIANSFQQNDSISLFESIKASGAFKTGKVINDKKQGTFPQLSESVLSGAHFFSKFEDINDFYKWTDFFDKDERARLALPLMLAAEIHGLGFALSCDFLKEIGYEGFGKPDVHLKEIFKGVGMMDKQKKQGNEDLIAFNIILRIAKNTNKTPYAIDKILWLIRSGNFYKSKIVVKSKRDDFIKMCN